MNNIQGLLGRVRKLELVRTEKDVICMWVDKPEDAEKVKQMERVHIKIKPVQSAALLKKLRAIHENCDYVRPRNI